MQIMPECLSTFIEININENDMCDLHAFDQVKKYPKQIKAKIENDENI